MVREKVCVGLSASSKNAWNQRNGKRGEGEEGDFKRQAPRPTYKSLLNPKGRLALRQEQDHRTGQTLPKEMDRPKVRRGTGNANKVSNKKRKRKTRTFFIMPPALNL
jgi:hypothetical protein